MINTNLNPGHTANKCSWYFPSNGFVMSLLLSSQFRGKGWHEHPHFSLAWHCCDSAVRQTPDSDCVTVCWAESPLMLWLRILRTDMTLSSSLLVWFQLEWLFCWHIATEPRFPQCIKHSGEWIAKSRAVVWKKDGGKDLAILRRHEVRAGRQHQHCLTPTSGNFKCKEEKECDFNVWYT